MKKIIQVLFLCLFLVCGVCFNFTNNTLKSCFFETESGITFENESCESMLCKTLDGVVTVFSSGKEKSMGSGFSVENHIIVTNQHVVDGGNEFNIVTRDGKKSKASLIYSSEAMDVAVLKIDKEVKVLKMGDSKKLKVGEEVYAIGTPVSFNFHHTVTRGIVSGLNRELELTKDKKTMKNLIQHDASINPGNSGGVLINSRGEVVGINTLKVSTFEGMGFAIPIDDIKPIIANISKNIWINK